MHGAGACGWRGGVRRCVRVSVSHPALPLHSAALQEVQRDEQPIGSAPARRAPPPARALAGGVRAARGRGDGRRRRDRVPPAPALAPLLRPLHLRRRTAVRQAVHTAELLGLVAGFFLFADLRRRRALAPAHAWAGLFLGLGGFQLFDGIVDHKLLRVHQIRYGVDVTGYDWAWNGAGAALFLLGAALAVRARGRARGGRRRRRSPPTRLAADTAPACFGAVLVLGAALSAAGYLAAAARLRRRGDGWPRHRDALFAAGCAALAGAAAGTPPGGPFTVHMIRHLVFAMAVPPVLAAARPVTLVLRTLPAGPPRRALRAVLGSARGPAAVPTDGGGTGRGRSLAAVPHAPALPLRRPAPARRGRAPPRPGLRTAPRLRRLLPRTGPPPVEPRLAGRRPARRRGGPRRTRRTLYATPPPGTAFATADLRRGAQWMYYGGDLAELALASLLAADWYARTGRARRRAARRRRPSPARARPGRRPDRPCRWPTGCAGLFRSFPATRLP